MKQQTQIVKRHCPYRNCNVVVEIENPMDIEFLGAVHTKFCKFHERVYHRRYVLMNMALARFQKKGLKGLVYGHDLSNYLYSYNKKEFNKIEKRAIQWVKKHG